MRPNIATTLALACLPAGGESQAQSWFFEDVTAQAGAAGGHDFAYGDSGEPGMISGGAAAADVDGDGDIDLYANDHEGSGGSVPEGFE
ncbi:MAG TPA: hypothetical protein VFG21_10675 [Xanthomonadaceae bacterium]|nr:hypothetical protein [Xanthomonadaceae bacterium]